MAVQHLSAGVSGKLIMNVLVMYDRQTNSLWSQLLGQAVDGRMKGAELTFVKSLQTTWAEWQRLHPDSLALQKDFRGSQDSYESYYLRSSAGVLGETHQDNRLYVKECIVGVALDNEAKAYPLSQLNDEPVVNDALSGKALLVVFDAESATAAVFSREVEGRILNFRLETPGGPEGSLLVDEETGTIWAAFTGEGLEGPLAGAQLPRIKSTSSFWFDWKDWCPDTAIYGFDG